MGKFGFWQCVRKLPENLEKMLFYESYFKEGNINRKPLILSHYKIITKFGPKKLMSLVLGKMYPKSKQKCYFTKLISKRVISAGNQLFFPKI